MTSNNKTIIGSGAKKDDDPTSGLEVLRESAALELQTEGALETEATTGVAGSVSRPGTAAETIASLQSDLKSRAKTIGKLEFELQHLKSKWTGLKKEVSVLENVMSSSVAEAKSARQKHLETNELLGKRDIEVESLKSQLQAKERELENSAQQIRALSIEAQEVKSVQGEFERSRAVESRTRHEMERETEPKQGLIVDCTDAAEEPYDLAMLVPVNGDASGQRAIKTGLLSLGSSPDNDIRIEGEFISRHHAQIVSDSADSILRDLNSTNGTYVNSKRIKRHALRSGDSIRVGKHRFRYVKRNLGSCDYETSIDAARIK
jgi:hypothetical protein